MFSSTTRGVAAAAGLALATASLAACSPSSSNHGLAVVATTTQICDYVTRSRLILPTFPSTRPTLPERAVTSARRTTAPLSP